ncbi:MAG: beta-ketoacyl-[acyl-carrier-protein] synthase family protein [Acidobacteriota bacterium]
MSNQRIVISGLGVVSAYGAGTARYWDNVSQGVSGTRAITEFDVSSYPCRVAAPVPALDISAAVRLEGEDDAGWESRADPKRYSRAALFGVVAGREAWRDAGLRVGEPGAGVIIGSGGGGIDVGERQYQDFFTNGGRAVTPYAIAVGICGMVSSEISISLGLRGISHVLSTGCTSSTDAMGYALALLRAGDADVLLSGGTDGCVLPGMIFGFGRMRAVSTHYNDRPEQASRPFDRGRDGFVLGEGAWMVVLEREARARARGAHIYATLDGYASTCDAYHRVQMAPDGDEIVRCMQTAVTRSGRALDDIGYVNYHGTSTQLNDAVEARCTRRAFGALAERLPGSSTKSMIGHPQGASGAAGVVATALALDRGFLPPTINLTDPDPACDLDFLPQVGRAVQVESALCNCLGFGSKNSALVLGYAG